MKKEFRIIVLALLISTTISYSCKKDKTTQPVVSTTDVTDITQTLVTSGGNITDDGGAPIMSRGVCWSTNKKPTITDNKTLDGTGTGSYISSVDVLLANTIYFLRAYATNDIGIGYGPSVSFTTLPATTPILTTSNITNITQNSASSGGTITSDGAASVIAKGICWSLNQNPTLSDNKTSDGTGTGNFISTLTELIGNTTYYLRAYATNNTGTGYGAQVSFTTNPVIPTVTTLTISLITSTSCSSGGNITSAGGASITARGVCWSTSANPTIQNSNTSNGLATGAFISLITGLTANMTYYIRAYATNSAGTGYGNQYSFLTLANGQISDIDGNIYNTVAIGTQVWMAENLKTTKYRNGELIGTSTPATLVTRFETASKYQWAYNGNESNVATHGRLYTWFIVTDGRGICPTNWHVPTNSEWTALVDYLAYNGYGVQGNSEYIGKSLAGTSGWNVASDPEDIGYDQTSNNRSGFTALPCGWRDDGGVFIDEGYIGFWWAYGQGSNPLAATFKLMSSLGGAYRSSLSPNEGLSIRCVKD